MFWFSGEVSSQLLTLRSCRIYSAFAHMVGLITPLAEGTAVKTVPQSGRQVVSGPNLMVTLQEAATSTGA
jgi:hypothetical protein